MRYSMLALALVGCGLWATPARADLAPLVPPAQEAKIKIELDANAKTPKLVIPINAIQPGRPRPRPQPLPGKNVVPPPGAVPPNAAPPAGNKPEDDLTDGLVLEWAEEQPSNRNHVLVAGLALTLSLSFGGLWVMRRYGRGSVRSLVLLVAAGATLAGSAVAWANAPPPKLQPKVAALPALAESKISVEFTPGGGDIRLVLDKATYDKLLEKPKGEK